MQLVIRSGPAAGQHYDLGSKPITLGTNPTSEIQVADATIDGRHARFENIGGTFYVTNLASDKNTYLNSQRMSPEARYPLRADDFLQFGSTLFQIQAAAPASAAPIITPQPAAEGATLQPYQYQISTTYSPPPPLVTPPPAQAANQPTRAAQVIQPNQTAQVIQPKLSGRKVNWSAIFAGIFVVGLIGAAIAFYFINSSVTPIEVKNTGQVTRTAAIRLTPTPTAPPPTNTVDPALYKPSTPGIGGDKPITPVQVSTSDIPVYPGARRIDNDSPGVYFTQFVTTDSFDKLSDWAKTAFSDKGWTNVEVKPLPGKEGTVLTGRKGTVSMVTYLLGPGQKDTAPYNNFFKSANVDPNGAVVVINITGL